MCAPFFFMKKIIFIFLFFLANNHSFAYYDFNANCQKAFCEIMNLRFDKGKQLIELEKKIRPTNDIPYFIENYIDFLSVMIGNEEDIFLKMKSAKDNRIERLEHGEKNSPYYKYCLAEVELQYAFCSFKFNANLSSAYGINKAYRLLKKNQEEYPWFIQNLKGLGVIHSLVENVPENYKWIVSLCGMESKPNEGIKELKKVFNFSIDINSFAYIKIECAYLLTSVQLLTGADKNEQLILSKQLDRIYTDSLYLNSPLLAYCRAKTAYSCHDASKAERIISSLQTSKENYPFCYLDYFTGILKLDRLDKDVVKYFNRFLSCYKGKDNIHSSYQKMAWYYLINNNLAQYKRLMMQINQSGNSSIDEDKQADNEAKSNIIPNEYLLKSRLLFDGGYYSEAFEMLKKSVLTKSIHSKKDSLEYFYRAGRIYHENGETQQAIDNYKKTLTKGVDEKYYNASLQLGIIYENLSNDQLAMTYFQKVSSCKNTEYKNSIEQKAKSKLKRLKEKTKH